MAVGASGKFVVKAAHSARKSVMGLTGTLGNALHNNGANADDDDGDEEFVLSDIPSDVKREPGVTRDRSEEFMQVRRTDYKLVLE